ncbi:hypothetical protein E5D57_009904 [Metarhizium anisopliae]|nr:hypothetical protein E5D57_009904 [Metarhizium anisopliae]
MPDIDPAALSRPAVSLSTPTLSNKTLSITAPGSGKPVKTSQIIPARIDLEPVYSALKGAIGGEKWLVYKESTTEFLTGRLSQAEYSERIDPILADNNGERDHLHNQLIAAILGNVTREMPDQGLAPWVSANDKPMPGAGNFDLEIRKRFAQPLAIESGEFPDVGVISGRMLPFCYEAGLPSGHASDAPQLVTVATETFIKEVLTQIFSRTRSNGAGDSGNAGYGIGMTWIQTHKYKKQLHREEEAAIRGEITRDKGGLLPVEAKAANERGPLGMADLRLALEMADTGMAQFPILSTQVIYGYREGELEQWDDYTWYYHEPPAVEELVDGYDAKPTINGYGDAMDLDQETWWDGAETGDMDMLDGMLDSCLAVGS